jgi:hypothetical protein
MKRSPVSTRHPLSRGVQKADQSPYDFFQAAMNPSNSHAFFRTSSVTHSHGNMCRGSLGSKMKTPRGSSDVHVQVTRFLQPL